MTTTTTRTTPRSWRFWSKKYQKVEDPESSNNATAVVRTSRVFSPIHAGLTCFAQPSYEAPEAPYQQPVPTIVEPDQGGAEKYSSGRHSEDSYYVPPQLKYDYRAPEPTTGSLHSAKSSVTDIPAYDPPMYPPTYEPPAYPPPPMH